MGDRTVYSSHFARKETEDMKSVGQGQVACDRGIVNAYQSDFKK